MGNLVFGGTVAASRQFGANQTDVCSVDQNGQLNVIWFNAGVWNGPLAIGPAGIANPGSFVAASQQFGFNQTDVFLIDKNGQLNVFWVIGEGAWNGPLPIGPAGIANPGSFVAASQQFGFNQTCVFLVDKNGQLNVFWVRGEGAWNGPLPIGPAGIASPGSFLAASQQFGFNQTDVFLVDKNGQLNVFWVVGGGEWNGPLAIGLADFANPGSFIAVSQQFGANQTDVFLVDVLGRLNVLWVVGEGVWNGPTVIPPPPPPPKPPLPEAPIDLQPINGAAGVSNNPFLSFRDPGAGTPAAAGQFVFWVTHNNVLVDSPPLTGSVVTASPLAPPGVRWPSPLPVGENMLTVAGQNAAGIGPTSQSTFTVAGFAPHIDVALISNNIFQIQGSGFSINGNVLVSVSSSISDNYTQANAQAGGDGNFSLKVSAQSVCMIAGGGQLKFSANDLTTNMSSNVVLSNCQP